MLPPHSETDICGCLFQATNFRIDLTQLEVNEILSKGQKIVCPKGYWPNEKQDKCVNIHSDETFIPNYDSTSLPALCVDGIATICSVVIIGYAIVFFLNSDHVVCRKSGRHYFPFVFGGALMCQVTVPSF